MKLLVDGRRLLRRSRKIKGLKGIRIRGSLRSLTTHTKTNSFSPTENSFTVYTHKIFLLHPQTH